MKVFLNPGHAPGGHPDPGAVNSESGLRECDVALAVGQSAESYLNAVGVATELLQSNSLAEICEAANASDADIFVSIHCNAAEAEAAIKSINLDDVQKLVEAQMKNLTDLLEAEIQTTTSWWVKIRNRLYITLMQQAVKAIVADVKQKIA